MSVDLLKTKLFVPSPRSDVIRRPRLFSRLNRGLSGRLTLLSAPAGFGKTTLLSSWIQAAGLRPAWLTVDETDNDPVRFLTYFHTALRSLFPELGPLPFVESGPAGPIDYEATVNLLLNEMESTATVDRLSVIVLDDYHLIRASEIHRAVDHFLLHMPNRLHVAIATREDPPLSIPLMRGRGQIVEIRLADIRFEGSEASAFLRESMELDLSAEDVDALQFRTEGWIAGLQMAAVTLQARDDFSSFIRSFTGSNRHVLDYLVEEALANQTQSTQSFLLATSILDRLTGSLCDAVCETEDGQKVLESLEQANLFIIPLDENRVWYRYHRLFKDMLRLRLASTRPELVSQLHRRAIDWYKGQGLVEEAITHALSTRDFAQAAALIESAAEETLKRSQIATLLNWLESLPVETVKESAKLCIYAAMTSLLAGRRRQAIVDWLRNAERQVADPVVAAATAGIRGLLATFEGDAETSARLSKLAAEQLPGDLTFLRHAMINNLALALLLKGDVDSAIQALEEAAAIGRSQGNVATSAGAMANVAGLVMNRGSLHRAEAIYRRSLELATTADNRFLPVAGKALLGLGEIARDRDQLEAAEKYFQDAIGQFSRYGDLGSIMGYLSLARVKESQGEMDQALEYALKAREIAIDIDATDIDDLLVGAYLSLLALRRGNVDEAAHWLESRGLPLDGDHCELLRTMVTGEINIQLKEYELLVLARALLAANRPDESLPIVDNMLLTARQSKRDRFVIRYLILKALICQAGGRVDAALDSLQMALELAEPEGFIRLFVDEGRPMAELLDRVVERGNAPDHVRTLLMHFPERGRRPLTDEAKSQGELVEPLSKRELEVLDLIALGLTNQQIAGQLFISLSTVKGHASSIYGKLGVANRAQAVSKGRDLGLVASEAS